MPEKNSTWVRVTMGAAIIGALGVIIAAIIGNMKPGGPTIVIMPTSASTTAPIDTTLPTVIPPEVSDIRVTATTIKTSNLPLKVCGEQAFETGSFVTSSPHFVRPEGYTSGWITSDPLQVVLSSDVVETLSVRSIIVTTDLQSLQLRSVSIGNIWGCWLRDDITSSIMEEVKNELQQMKEDAPNTAVGVFEVRSDKIVPIDIDSSTDVQNKIWQSLLTDWVVPESETENDKRHVATGPFYFKVETSEGELHCGVVAPGVEVKATEIFGRPLIEHWPITSKLELINYLTSADGQNNNTNDMEDFCMDSLGYQPIVVFYENQQLISLQLELPLPKP